MVDIAVEPIGPDIITRTKREEKLVRRILGMYEYSLKEKRNNTTFWKSSYEFYRGKMWGRRPTWKASPKIPMLSSKIESVVPIMTDNRPTAHVLAASPEFMEHANAMQKVVNDDWTRQHMDQTVECATRNCLLFGAGFYHLFWDHDEEEPETENMDPANAFPDPKSTGPTTLETRSSACNA